MPAGDNRQQIEALKGLLRRWSADRIQLRFVVVLAILLGGWLGVEMPLSDRLARARSSLEEARKQARLAEELRHFADQARLYEERVAVPADLVDWQNYVLGKLQGSSATLLSLEPKETAAKQPFSVIEMELVARTADFADFTDFIDRLEHGERLVRIERVRYERQQTSMYVTLIIRGLVKGAPKPAGKARAEDAALPPGSGPAVAETQAAPQGEASPEGSPDSPAESPEPDAAPVAEPGDA